MVYIFYISILVLGVLFIIKDYRTTKGFMNQKIIHIFSILFIFLINITAFRNLFAVVRNYKTYSEWSIHAQIDYLPDEIGLAISFFQSLIGAILYVSAFGLLVRGNFSRRLVIWVIPITILLSLPIIHHKYHNNYNSLEQIIGFWVAIIFYLTLIGIFFLYRSMFMKSFFVAKKQQTSVEQGVESS